MTVEDIQAVQQAFTSLNAAKGDRKRTGLLEWEEAKKESENAIDVLAVHKRPTYDYGDLAQLLEELE